MLPTFLFAAAFLLLAILLLWIAWRAEGFQKLWAAYLAAWLAVLLAGGWIPSLPGERERLLATLAIELPIAAAYILWHRRPAALLLTIVLGINVITHPVLSFAVAALYPLAGYTWAWTLVCELAVWVVEAAVLGIALRKMARFREALLFSLILNLASFGIGLLLPF